MIKENQKYLNRFHVVFVLVTGDSYGNTKVYFSF